MRIFDVTISAAGDGERVIRVPSKTGVQAGDAAVTQMRTGETILSIQEVDDPLQQVDAPPAGTQTHPDQPV